MCATNYNYQIKKNENLSNLETSIFDIEIIFHPKWLDHKCHTNLITRKIERMIPYS